MSPDREVDLQPSAADDTTPSAAERGQALRSASALRPAPPRPERPSLRSENKPPVLVKEPPPFAVRLSQLLWVLSFSAGLLAVVYFSVSRQDQVKTIVEFVKSVDGSRPEATYTSAADIVYWSAFAVMAGLLLVQVTLLVSFVNRRQGTRWWQLATLVLQVVLYALFLEVIESDVHGEQLRHLLIGQCGLVCLALLAATLRPALAWTARQHDVRRAGVGSMSAEM